MTKQETFKWLDACELTIRIRQRRALLMTSRSANDGETAIILREMKVCLVRPTDDDGTRLWLMIRLPGGEELDVQIARAQLLQQLDIDADEVLNGN